MSREVLDGSIESSEVLRRNVGIEGAPEGQVVPNCTQSGDIDGLVQGGDERGHIAERHRLDDTGRDLGGGLDLARRRVDPNHGFRGFRREHAGVEHDLGQGDDAVTAHRGEAVVVDEKDREVARRVHGRADEGAVHVGMAPWLPHQAAPQVIEMGLGEPAALEHGCPMDVGVALDDHPKRLPSGVGIDDHHSTPIRWRLPAQRRCQVQACEPRRRKVGHGRALPSRAEWR